MGPEALFFPLTVAGLLGILALCVLIFRKRGRSWLTVVLIGSGAFASWGAQGYKTWEQAVVMFLFVFPVGFVCIALPLWIFMVLYRRMRSSPLISTKSDEPAALLAFSVRAEERSNGRS